jgi:DNA-binding CsgD family transcriptional regulator
MGGAAATIAEGLELAGQLGYENDETGLLALKARLEAMRGNEDECRETAQAAMQRSLVNGIGWATKNAHMALAELELGLGNPQLTIEHLEQLDPSPLPPLLMFELPDLIDAALRVGDREKAQEALDRLTAWLPVTRAPTVRAMHARCRAMLAADTAEAETLFAEALALHPDDAPPFERARTQLAFGERLRRDRRRIESRTQLRTALDTFEGLGTRLWAERARGELNATGETARKRDVSTIDDLTPQELRIAQLVAGGASNREAAAQLFVSPKTVDYHLRKVFLKLGVSSRVELAHMPLGDPVPAAAASPG